MRIIRSLLLPGVFLSALSCSTTERVSSVDPVEGRIDSLIAEMTIELNTLRRFNQLIYWRRFAKKPHPYGGPQQRYYQRMLRLRNGERLQAIMGADALEQNLSVHEVVDFEYAVRTGPGQLHGGGTLDTDRLIFARRLGLGRPTTEKAPETD